MNILYCCPKCRCEDLEIVSKPEGIAKCLNKSCNNTFGLDEAGLATKDFPLIKINVKGKKKTEYVED